MHLDTDPAGNPSPSVVPFPHPSPVVIPFVLPDSKYFDAGPSLTVTGPGGTRQLVRSGASPYGAILNTTSALYLTSGDYTIDNAGQEELKSEDSARASDSIQPSPGPTVPLVFRRSAGSRRSRSPGAGGDSQHELVMINGTLSTQSCANTPEQGIDRDGLLHLCRTRRGRAVLGSIVCPLRTACGQLRAVPGWRTDFSGQSNPCDSSVSSISRLDQNMFLAPGLDAGYFVWLAADSINVSFNFCRRVWRCSMVNRSMFTNRR